MASAADLSASTRSGGLASLASQPFDVLVIGGGVTGAGVALDAAVRGYRVGLIEREDFASGTSASSTKLVHGGIRYLPQLDVPLVREALIERGRLLCNAPYLVHPLAFVLPLYASSRHPVGLPVAPPGGVGLGMILDAGLRMYDVLAGKENIATHQRIGRDEVLDRAPCLVPEGLETGFLYFDAQTDDTRLTLALVRTAAYYGACVVNYCEAHGFIREDDHLVGVRAIDRLAHDERGDNTFEIRAHHIINATGVWAEQTERLAGEETQLRIAPSKGTHLVVSKKTVGVSNEAIVLPETSDGRIIFVVPWQSRALIGTTDQEVREIEHPVADDEEIDYLVAHVNKFMRCNLTRDDIITTFSGNRPLLRLRRSRTPARLSRTHAVVESPDGLVTVSGGKLTTYRRMAQDVMNRVDQHEKLPRRNPTLKLQLVGSSGWVGARDTIRERAASLPVSEEVAAHLDSAYGAEALHLLDLVEQQPDLAERLIEDLPYIGAEVVWACRAELAVCLADVLMRRTHIAIEDRTRGTRCAERTADLMSRELGWDVAERARQVTNYVEQARLLAGPLADRITWPPDAVVGSGAR